MNWLVLIALLGGCYNPAKDGHCSLQCMPSAADKACPDGMTCGPDLRCHDDDREDCTKQDGGTDAGCWKFWKSTNGPQLGTPKQMITHATETLTNPSLTQDGMNMFVSVREAPNQVVQLSRFDGNMWFDPVGITTDGDNVRIRCTLPSTNAYAICVDNSGGVEDLRLVKWVATELDQFSLRSENTLVQVNTPVGPQTDPEISRDGTQLFFTSDGTMSRAIRQGANDFLPSEELTPFSSADGDPTISPTGDVMVFTRDQGGKLLFFGVHLSGTQWKTAPLEIAGEMADLDTDPELSPDGCQLFTASRRGARGVLRDIYAFPITGSR